MIQTGQKYETHNIYRNQDTYVNFFFVLIKQIVPQTVDQNALVGKPKSVKDLHNKLCFIKFNIDGNVERFLSWCSKPCYELSSFKRKKIRGRIGEIQVFYLGDGNAEDINDITNIFPVTRRSLQDYEIVEELSC